MMPKFLFWSNITEGEEPTGTLTDCISCKVTRNIKGVYECELKYPITGAWYKYINLRDWILVDAEEGGTPQPFEIYRKSADMSGIVTYNCRHAKYHLGLMAVMPYTATTAAAAMAGLASNNPVSELNNRFTFTSEISRSGEFKSVVPMTPLQLLEGGEGSITDVFGGAVDYDGFLVTLKASLGRKTDLTIRYGKNLTDLKLVEDAGDTYDAIIPYWYKKEVNQDTGEETDILVTTYPQYTSKVDHIADENEDRISDEHNWNFITKYPGMSAAIPMDFSQQFDTEPQPIDLFAAAQTILINGHTWEPKEDIDLGFIPIWQTEEYKDQFSAEQVTLYDTLHVYYEALHITKDAQVVQTVYDALLGRYEMLGIETIRDSFADTMINETANMVKSAAASVNERGRTISQPVLLPTGFNEDGTVSGWVKCHVKKGIIE